MEGSNYYVRTFIGDVDNKLPKNLGEFYWTYRKYDKVPITWNMFQKAVNNLLRFNLILVMDWLEEEDSIELVQKVLGWKTPPKQVRKFSFQLVFHDVATKS